MSPKTALTAPVAVKDRGVLEGTISAHRALAAALLFVAAHTGQTVAANAAQAVAASAGQAASTTVPAVATAPSPAAAARPRDEAGGSALFLRGPVTAVWGPSGARITVGEVSNQETPSTDAGNPGLQLVATPTVPTVVQDGLIETGENTDGFHVMAASGLPTVGPGADIFNIDIGNIPYVPPPPGCYYVSVALTQDIDLLGTVVAMHGHAKAVRTRSRPRRRWRNRSLSSCCPDRGAPDGAQGCASSTTRMRPLSRLRGFSLTTMSTSWPSAVNRRMRRSLEMFARRPFSSAETFG